MNFSYPNGFGTSPLVVVKDSTWLLRLLQIFLLVAMVINVVTTMIADMPTGTMGLLGGIPMLIIIVIEVVIRVFGPRWRKVYTIDSSTVMCQTNSDTWIENTDSYQDVHWFTEVRGSGKNRNTYQVVALRHQKNDDHTVRLVDSQRQAGVRAKWESAAKLVGRPATKDLGGGKTLRREVEDLDLSIRELVDKGALVDDFDGSREVPAGIRWHQQGGRLEVRLRRPRTFYMIFLAVIGVFGGIMAVASEGEPLVMLGLLVALGVVILVMLAHQQRLVIEGPTLAFSGLLMGVPYRPSKRLVLDEIESIYARNPKAVFSPVHVESDRLSLSLGPVSARAGQWLEKFLISAIATAPRG